MTIEKLVAGAKGASGNSTGADIADAVNALIDKVGRVDIDAVKAVYPDDFFPISCYEHISSSMLGQSSAGSGQIVQVNMLTKEQSNYGNSLPVTGLRNIKAITESMIIAEADGGTGFYKLYKTEDAGDTWQLVLTQEIENVRMLTNRSICIASVNGQVVLFFGEYNVNTSRVNGAANDQVRLLRSDDLGSTWTEVTRWNTDGTNNNIRHIHAVKQNHVNGRIYVITGDSNDQSSIYSWDGVSAWPPNVNPSDTVQTAGLRNVSGRQAFRTVDLLFKDELIYMMPDAPTGAFGNDSECGIWTISQDLNLDTLTRVSTVSTHMTGIAGWLADWLPDGRQIWLGGNEILTSGEKYNCLIVSNKALTQWEAVGAYRSTNVSTFIVPLNLFCYNETIYVSCATGSGKSSETTVSCKMSDLDFRGKYKTLYTPDTIHPVYWVDEVAGDNSNNGWTPRSPFKSAEHALTGGRVTFGGRLQIIGAELYVRNAIQPALQGNARSGDPTEFATIQGFSATSTSIIYDKNSTSTTFVNFANNTGQAVEFRDLSVKTAKSGINGVECFAAAVTGQHKFRSVRCLWGIDFDGSKFSRIFRSFECPILIYGSIIVTPPDAALPPLDSKAGGGSNYFIEKSVCQQGRFHYVSRGANNIFRSIDLIHVGASDASFSFLSGSQSSISCLKSQFWTVGVKSSSRIADGSSRSWTGNEFLSARGNQNLGIAAAFDGYSILNQGPIPLINYDDYVY